MRTEWHLGFWAALAAGVALLLYVLSSVLLPFAAAIALGYLLDPVADKLEKWGLSRLAATLLILAFFILFFTLALVLLAPVLGHQLAAFVAALPDYVVKLQKLATGQMGRILDSGILNRLGLGDGLNSEQVQKAIADFVGQGGKIFTSFVGSLWAQGQALINLVSLIVITPVVAFYMLLDWDKMVASLDSLVPLRYRDDVHHLAREIDAALAGFLRGQSLLCLFLGLWYGLGLALIGLNFGFLIGLSAGVLSFIPYVGSLTALILSAIVAVVQAWPDWTLLAMAMGVVATGQFLEGNILSPKLVGNSVGLHPVWLMFALLAFGSLFGFTGLILAVPLAATFGVILRFVLGRYRDSALYHGGAPPAPPVAEA